MNRPLAALVSSGVVAVVVVVVVLVFGVIPLPEFASLQKVPDRSIAGTVVFIRRGGREDRCLMRTPASGAMARRVTCRLDGRPIGWNGPALWTTDGKLAVTQYDETGANAYVLDAGTGAVVERLASSGIAKEPAVMPSGQQPDRTKRADGAIAFTGSPERGVATVSVRDGASTRVVLRARGPRDYRFDSVQWSPDGRWILVQESSKRLLVLDPSTRRARVLAEDAMDASWFVPGNATYTVDVEKLRVPASR